MRYQYNKYLTEIRRLPCISCDQDPAREAAHVRYSAPGKPNAGMGAKPADRYTLPLCSHCHTRGPHSQHRVGEDAFWSDLGLDPLEVCEQLNAAFPDLQKMRAVIFAARERRR
jgi:hypothetical protein